MTEVSCMLQMSFACFSNATSSMPEEGERR